MAHHGHSSSRALRGPGLLAVLVLALTACGGTSAQSNSSATASSQCTTIPNQPPADPDGVLASLPAQYRSNYNGYTGTIHRSAWASWAPRHPAPWKVGVSFSQILNPFQAETLSGIQNDLKRDPQIGSVITEISPLDVTQQLQQFNSLVQQGVDLIIYEPLAPAPFAPAVDEAAKAGIPSLDVVNTTPTANSVNQAINSWLGAADVATRLMKVIGGRGSILEVHGIPGTSADSDTFAGFDAVLKRCPGVTVAGSVTGNFSTAQAKSETLKFLATHPGKIAGVLETAVMAPGVISAFEQVGRPVPPVTDGGAQLGSLAYWRDHRDTYQGVATGGGTNALASGVADVAIRMLEGQGVKISDVVGNVVDITSGNLDQWVTPAATLDTPGTAQGPSSNYILPDSYLDRLFNHPSAPR